MFDIANIATTEDGNEPTFTTAEVITSAATFSQQGTLFSVCNVSGN